MTNEQIVILSNNEIKKMREVGKMAAKLLDTIGEMVEPGISTLDLDIEATKFAKSNKIKNAPFGYMGFPRSICTSVNNVICHGIPSKKKILRNGDIINIDVTVLLEGYHGDTSKMFFAGTPSNEARELVKVAKECLDLGVKQILPGKKIGDIGYAIQQHAEFFNYSVVRDFVGHGIGKRFHSEPQIPHFGKKNKGLIFREGMAFTVEPMINQGTWEAVILDDKWTAVTKDGKLSAQFEHTVLVTSTGVEILT